MEKMMSDEIVVVASRINTYTGEYISIPSISLPVNSLQSDGQTLRQRLEARASRADPILVSATATSPATTMTGVTNGQAAAVAAALVNVASSAELSSSFAEMVTKNVSLRVDVVTIAPTNFSPNQLGGIAIPALEPIPGGAQQFSQNSEVVIVVVASRLNNSSLGNETFRSVFAHELAHLIRDANGRFLTDTSSGAYAADGPLQRELYKGFKEKEFLDTPDIVSQVSHDPSLVFGPQYAMVGTNENNYMLGPNFFAGGNITTGDGNDIFLAYGTANVAVSLVGTKMLYTTYAGVVIYPAGTDVEAARLERVGNDLFITFGHTGSSLLAENAVVLLDHYGSGAFLGMTAVGNLPQQYRPLREY